MRLREALKDHQAIHVLAEATLARLGLIDEAAIITMDKDNKLSGAAVACDKGLVLFTLGGPARIHASIQTWSDVAPPTLSATTEEKLETILMTVRVL